MKSQAWKMMATGALLVVMAAGPSVAQTLPAGNDGWSTPGGGQTRVNLSQYPDVLGSPIVGGSIVYLKGKPLNPASLGTIDTLLERGPVTLSSGSGTGNLKIVALSLESENAINLQDGRSYRLAVSLSSTPAPAGSIALTKTNADGGTFTSQFPILPKLTFTNVSDPNDVLTVDCGSGGCPPLELGSTNTAWVTSGGPTPGNFDPGAAGVTPIQSGIAVGGYTTIGNINGGFYAGFTPSRPGYGPAPFDEQGLLDSHRVQPVRDCLRQGRAATGKRAGKASGGFDDPVEGIGPGVDVIEPNRKFCITQGTIHPGGTID